MNLKFRDHALPSDVEAVRSMVGATGFFSPEEVLIAVELLQENLARGSDSGYHFLFCEDGEAGMIGYTCFGPIPGTKASFDLYWIVVDARFQGRGIGQVLLGRTEDIIAVMGGSRIYVETSSRELYAPTRKFYSRSGYAQEAVLRDFYAPGDSKLIYVKVLGQFRKG